jgi:hypothetical protein
MYSLIVVLGAMVHAPHPSLLSPLSSQAPAVALGVFINAPSLPSTANSPSEPTMVKGALARPFRFACAASFLRTHAPTRQQAMPQHAKNTPQGSDTEVRAQNATRREG